MSTSTTCVTDVLGEPSSLLAFVYQFISLDRR